MGKILTEIAQQLINDGKKVQLIYAFNGTGKTRLSKEFKTLIQANSEQEETEENRSEPTNKNILYYSAFTEDLFYWDNDLKNDSEPKLKIHPNIFINWVFVEQGQEQNVIEIFQSYTDEKLTPYFNSQSTITNDIGVKQIIESFTEVHFRYARGNKEKDTYIKISKGEESCFIWSVFYALLDEVVSVLNIPEENDRETDQFNNLQYVFIDDPVSSLDDNHLIELAVNLAKLIKSSESSLKFVVTTHNPLFYNVLYNEFSKAKKYILKKDEGNQYDLVVQQSDSPFSYHLFLMSEIEKAITLGQLKKYHFNFIRNVLEKTATFLGYKNWGDLLPENKDGHTNPYESRIINISSHSKHSGDETIELSDADKRVLKFLMEEIKTKYHFKL
ncbi:MAG: AAA family ATPase [Culicoidibacterales bacterium]